MPTLTEFRPSIWGWPFSNIGLKLCGGFCYTVLDRYYSAGNLPPDEGSPDSNPNNLHGRLFAKEMDSLRRYGGKAPSWQQRPDIGHKWNWWHSMRHVVRSDEWPRLQRRLANDGTPVILCEIRAEGLLEAPTNNHFVVAWGFEENGNQASVYIYDPNRPGMDNVKIEFTPDGDWTCRQTESSQRCRGFFGCDYP